MDIGTGIFLGLLFIGFVWLYLSTRDRWRWKRIVLWCAAIILVSSAVLGGWVWYDNYQKSKPRFQATLWDLRPGMTPEDVVFAKGEPKFKDTSDGDWIYFGDGTAPSHIVTWKNGKVLAVAAFVTNNERYKLPTVPGVSSYDSLEDIEKKLGKPDFVSKSKDNTRRMVSYLRFGLFFNLEKNELAGVGVLDPKEGPMRYEYGASSPAQ